MRVGRHFIALALGVVATAKVALVVSAFSPVAAIIVFSTMVLVWVGCAVSLARRQVEACGKAARSIRTPSAVDSRSAAAGVSVYHA
jgi:hypothetical protein